MSQFFSLPMLASWHKSSTKEWRIFDRSVFNEAHKPQWEEINLQGVLAIVGPQRDALSLTLKAALGLATSLMLVMCSYTRSPPLHSASLSGLLSCESSSLTSCRLHMKANRRISLYKQLDPSKFAYYTLLSWMRLCNLDKNSLNERA